MNDIIDQNKTTYDSLADQYEAKVSTRKEFNTGVIERFIPFIETGNNVLDVGCAVGLDMEIFTTKGFTVTGIEVSAEMVKKAKIRNPKAKILQGDFTKEVFDQQFDAIWAQSFIHLFPKKDVSEIFKKIYLLLQKNAVAFISTTKSEISKEGWEEKKDYDGKHKRYRKHWTKTELKEELEKASFKILENYEIADPYGKVYMVFTVKK